MPRNLWIVIGLSGCHFDSVLTGDLGDNNVHPSLIAFLNIFKIPILPSSAFGFGGSNRCGDLFHVNDALRSRPGRTLMDGNLKTCVINIPDGIFGRGGKVLIKILIIGSLIVGGAPGGQNHKGHIK